MLPTYRPKGVCSQLIKLDIEEDNIINSVEFFGGCAGNTKGVAALVKGKDAKEVIALLKGIHCGFKNTSCPDQLAMALEKIVK
ncbi:MAG: TIGR03905 family TSCPD domain-containing protein [Hydrogenoanaerobacterium sp.]